MRSSSIAVSLCAVVALLAAADGEAQGRGSGRGNQPPPGPAPRYADGRIMLTGDTPTTVGVWTPNFGISDPVAPYDTVPFQPWAKALYDARQVHEMEPHARCKASGGSRQFLTPYGVEFVEITALEALYIFDIGGPHTFRTVYMDGRSHPADIEPTNYGHSIGWWEGDTLVVDTVGFNEDFWFDRRGLPHTEALHTVERFTRVNERQMTYTIEVHDPMVYTGPFTGGFQMTFQPGTELFEYVCQQGNLAAELMVGGGAESVDRTSTIIP